MPGHGCTEVIRLELAVRLLGTFAMRLKDLVEIDRALVQNCPNRIRDESPMMRV